MGRGLHQASKDILNAAYDILEEIHPASVRAVCYKLFVRKLIPDMGKGSTGKVSTLLVRAREDGSIPWEWIVDGSRAVQRVSTWNNPKALMRGALHGYRLDFWKEQENRVHLIVEKETVASTLRPVLDEFAVPVSFMKGFASATAVNDLAEVIGESSKPMRLLYCGDYDPSGMYMSEEDLPERIKRYGGGNVYFERIAINEDDTHAGLPSFPAADKTTDTRYEWFVKKYGPLCWELDALDPNDLRGRVRESIEIWIDHAAWDHAKMIEAAQRESMESYFAKFPGGSLG